MAQARGLDGWLIYQAMTTPAATLKGKSPLDVAETNQTKAAKTVLQVLGLV